VAQKPIELKRHYEELSPKETDEVVNAVADLVVNYLKGRPEELNANETEQEVNHERDQSTEQC